MDIQQPNPPLFILKITTGTLGKQCSSPSAQKHLIARYHLHYIQSLQVFFKILQIFLLQVMAPQRIQIPATLLIASVPALQLHGISNSIDHIANSLAKAVGITSDHKSSQSSQPQLTRATSRTAIDFEPHLHINSGSGLYSPGSDPEQLSPSNVIVLASSCHDVC